MMMIKFLYRILCPEPAYPGNSCVNKEYVVLVRHSVNKCKYINVELSGGYL